MRKMPYKHIAAQLRKTELACRLHYHQLSLGGKRRPRGTSVSSSGSTDRGASIPPLDQTRESTPQRHLPVYSIPRSPEDSSRNHEGASCSPHNHIPILPRPAPTSQRATDHTKSLHLITADIDGFGSQQNINMKHLDKVYDAHRLNFWSMIARSYGCNLSPAVLEDAWKQAHCVSGGECLPTPGTSPQNSPASVLEAPSRASAEYGRVLTPAKTSGTSGLARSAIERNHLSGLAISSLLNEDKEVRSARNPRESNIIYHAR